MKYNIVIKNEKDFILAQLNTKEEAEKRIEEMKKNDLSLQKYYNWDNVPEYEIIIENEDIEELKETLEFYKKEYEKYTRLQHKVNQLQYNVNDEFMDEDKDINDVKMQVFELWYFARYNKEYGED